MGSGAVIATASPTMPSTAAPAATSSSGSAIAMGPGLDDLGISVRGVGSAQAAANLLDGPVDQSDAPPQADATFVAAATGGKQQPADPAARGSPPQDEAESAANKTSQSKGPSVIDASEGTPLDPLLNKTYDLDYAKSVPSSADVK